MLEESTVGALDDYQYSGYQLFLDGLMTFREKSSNTKLCDTELSLTLFDHDTDFAQLQFSTLKINRNFLSKLGKSFADATDLKKSKLANSYLSAALGLIAYFNSTETWPIIKGEAASYLSYFNWTSPLGNYNKSVAKKLVKEDPNLAFGLALYRVLTFKSIKSKEDQKYKQETHATPYQIANYLAQENHILLAKEILTLADEKGYYLIDNEFSQEITLFELENRLR